MVGGTLGCGTYEVYFKTRGGGLFLCRALNLTQLSWGRRLNEFSEASVTFKLNGEEGECCSCVGQINPWEHEMSVYREGVEVWCGPIIGGEINQETSTARFDARDLSAWFDKRYVEVRDTEVSFEEADITVVYNWLMAHAYNKEPWNMEWYFTAEHLGIPIDREYISYDPANERWGGTYPYVGDELRELRKSGIDFTVINRTYIAGDLDSSAVSSARLTDKDFLTPPTLIIVGIGMATEVGVGGGAGGYDGWYDDQIWIEKPYDWERETYGLLQYFEPAADLDEEETYALPNAIAQRAFALRELKKKPFTYIKNGALTQTAPITFDQLIPGRYIRVDLLKSCRPVESNYMLTSVSVDFGPNGETVNVELVPPGVEQLRG